MGKIFISYRRDDAEGQAGRLFKDLASQFGKGSVFMDVTDIPPGQDYRRVIEKEVASCSVLLAVIGKNWLDARDESGRLRLEDPEDPVRVEIASALKRNIPIFPVLVREADMPRANQLPQDLTELAYRNALELTHARWDSDVEELVEALRPNMDAEPGAGGRRSWRLVAAASVAVSVAIGGYVGYKKLTNEEPASGPEKRPEVEESPTPLQAVPSPTPARATDSPAPSEKATLFEPPSSFASYQSYLQNLGYVSKTGHVDVAVYPKVAGSAYYDFVRNVIVVEKSFAGDADVIFREYTHHALISVVKGTLSHPVLEAIESGLADYFPCSFGDDPVFGEKSAAELQKRSAGRLRSYIRNLENSRSFGEISGRMNHADAGEVWGGAFWELRGLLGREAADKLLFSTWAALQPSATLGNPARNFAHELAEAAMSREGEPRADQVREIFMRRGLKF